jgi:hypothetical protein
MLTEKSISKVESSTHGGKPSEFKPPYILKYGRPDSEPRTIKVSSTVYPLGGVAIGGSGHHHVDIREEENYILREDDGKIVWARPWDDWENDPYGILYILQGRNSLSYQFTSKDDVVIWANAVLANWGALDNPKYKIVWELDDDDPNADSMMANYLRKRKKDND